MKIGLYFGTFNPIHIGHMILANHLSQFTNLDQVWFVVTPLNPFKKKSSLLADHHRLQMVRIAVEDFPKLKASNIEFGLPQPNYTVNTLAHLYDKYPDYHFSLIMGEDNLQNFHKWKNYETILKNHEIYVYPRVYENKEKSIFHQHDKIHFVNAPVVEISSTFIRKSIQNKKDVRVLLPQTVAIYCEEMNFYKK